ncbi:WYL domain-containing protein [Butyrivibrio sp. TB]|uniref:WYL domain-containing protein n=1 Tax=Butyrivibrio sp. TB TaxID=1520809 RepID=UPI0008C0C6DC|nr:WYL domain-containing protein [Butyrivibrio sp. TB]SEQ67771.1 Predicted DNA-binding transcriptional regulator YafY, contains an HTH and WYL domains [Butyrivibrio sp. TB]
MAKNDYKQIVLKYLLQHSNEEIKREILISDTGISKSRLSEILNSIRADGYTIVSPPRSGILMLEQLDNQLVLPAIKDADLRQWIIIFLLSRYGALSFRDLVLKTLSVKDYDMEYSLKLNNRKVYDDNSLIKSIRSESATSIIEEDDIDVANDYISITTLRKDLNALRDAGLVSMEEGQKVTYNLTSKAPYIIPISGDSLSEFCLKYEEHVSATSELLPIKQAYNKIQKIISWDGSKNEQRRFGKINQISEFQIERFNYFISHSYKDYRITLHSEYNGKERHDTVSVGLLFYSVETNSFYALCYNHTHKRIEADRLDFIDTITEESLPNKIFHSQEYYQIYNEMFGPGYYPKVYHVKVLLQDFGNVIARFRNLTSIRKDSSIRIIDNPPEGCIYKYIYEDNVRGLDDFARILRSFGLSVLAVEPPELKDKMEKTYTWIIDKYENMDGLT